MTSQGNAADRAGRPSPAGIWIILGVVLFCAAFAYLAYQAAEAMLAALGSEQSRETAARLRNWLVFAALAAGITFAGLKFACQSVYGLIEVVVAAIMAAELAKTTLAKEPFAALMGLVGIAYIVVRGLENASKGYLVLQEKQRRGEVLFGPLRENPPTGATAP
ncbi:MAG: hypothetical protein K1X74_16715 [Pirellulales bacterium]|nr:hypothetical protein [Pirellulales bacterium]